MSGRQAKAARARQRRDYVHRFMVRYVAVLRRILKRAWPDYARRHPETPGPCHSCAFNPDTDTWPGFEKTALCLMEALQKDQPFYCHEHLPTNPNGEWYYDPTLPLPSRCRGWGCEGAIRWRRGVVDHVEAYRGRIRRTALAGTESRGSGGRVGSR